MLAYCLGTECQDLPAQQQNQQAAAVTGSSPWQRKACTSIGALCDVGTE